MEIRRQLRLAFVCLSIILLISVAGYRLLGGPSVTFLDALYMAIITLASVGYTEIVDTTHNPALRVFNIFVIVFGVTIMLYVFSVLTAFLVGGQITEYFGRRRMLKRISELKNHYIVCGLGDTGRHAMEELGRTNSPFVAIDHNEENIKRLVEDEGGLHRDMLYMIGDATDAEMLDRLGIERAKGLITTLGSDKENLIITVLARQKNAHVRIVTRCVDQKFAERLLKAGADSTVSPNQIGGMRIASEVLRPHVVSFLDLMLKDKSRTLRIEEIAIPGNSRWIGKQLAELHLRSIYNLLTLAVKDAYHDGQRHGFWANPPENINCHAGLVLIVLGAAKDVQEARKDAAALAFSAKV
ncbi:MAG TPA: potassium channel protein [Terriglobales bacterium]|nr:potassium channel protein [Terriglobales bacterium]